jgi:dihydroorotate dehydrogenase electron transfer subunit
MDPPVNQPGVFSASVARLRVVCDEHVEVSLRVVAFPQASPGQFVQVLCRAAPAVGEKELTAQIPQGWSRPDAGASAPSAPLLRRPFSLGGLRRMSDGCEIDLLFRIVGQGTAWLAARQSGEMVDVMGPFGRGFSPPPPDSLAILVAGGIGWPPIHWLAETLRAAGVRCEGVCGARQRALLPVTLDGEPPADGRPGLFVRELSRHGIPVIVTTDDGSSGVHGTVADGLRRLLDGVRDADRVRVFACGPHAMLRAVAEACAGRRVSCEVAMEQMMACGMGTCQSCVVPVRDRGSPEGWRYRLCCSDGPVFDASSIIWEQPVH